VSSESPPGRQLSRDSGRRRAKGALEERNGLP
jgi:Threonine synthase